MTIPAERAAAMAEGRRSDSARRRERAIKALQQAEESGSEISISAIARAAGVDRSFFYRAQHRDLLTRVHNAAAEPQTNGHAGPSASRASLQADLVNSQERSRRLADHVALLERRLSEALGEQLWTEEGLGSGIDIDALTRQVVALEETVADLRLRLEERDEELVHARAVNRDLMNQINHGRGPAT
jgi:hypothetical protein